MEEVTLPKIQASPDTELGKQRIITINSTAFYTLAYLFVYALHQLATVYSAHSSGIPSELFPGHIKFKIGDSQWLKYDVISVYSAGPLACLALSIFFMIWFHKAAKRRGAKKIFLLWVFIHGLNVFLGSLLAGCIAETGFWFAIQWSVVNYALVWIIAGLFALILIAAGVFLAPTFLLSCDSLTLMKFENRKKMLAATLVYPWLFGSLFITILKIPDLNLYESLQFFTLLFFLVPAYFQNLKNPISQNIEAPQRTRLFSGSILLTILGALAFRILVHNGFLFR
jgi:hypothetical protein